MAAGTYLYGFTDGRFKPAADLRGLGGAPVRAVRFREVAAIVSGHPVQRLMPLRSNLEPHHRIVRRISTEAALVPAAFGHISDSEADILAVLRENYDDIREELERLDQKCEMGVKLRWNVVNVFDLLVRTNRELRELRDRVFRNREPSLNEKLQVGSTFEATLNQERDRLSRMLLEALAPVTCEFVAPGQPRDEKTICQASLLVLRSRSTEFLDLLRRAAGLFDANFTLESSGPWPPYSFVRLRLQQTRPSAAA